LPVKYENVSDLIFFLNEKENLPGFLYAYRKIFCPVKDILININSPESCRYHFNISPIHRDPEFSYIWNSKTINMIITKKENFFLVLDVDSRDPDSFDEADAAAPEEIIKLV